MERVISSARRRAAANVPLMRPDVGFVLAGVEQFRGDFLGERYLEQPTVGVGMGVYEAWALGKGGVDCRDGASDWRVDFARSLHGFDDASLIA